jgi:hypothetical protein
MEQFLETHTEDYSGLKFRLVYLPEEPLKVMERYDMTNIRFERMDD